VPERVCRRLDVLRRGHPGWGIPYLRQQLLSDAFLTPEERARVPSLSAIYRYLHAVEDNPFPKKRGSGQIPTTPLVEQALYCHHLWQMDLKEKCKVRGLPHRVTAANVRDVHSSVTIASEIFELSRSDSGLTGADMQRVCRTCFSEWGLPDVLRTDNGSCFVGTMPQTGFPSYFVLWLRGLGVKHETIPKGKVTQNGCVERYNRTYGSLVLQDGPYENAEELRAVSKLTVDFLNRCYPSRAGTCRGKPPLHAHPEAKKPRRRYTLRRERKLFSLARVDEYLSQFKWSRRADANGRVTLGQNGYHLGRQHRRRVFDVIFDRSDRHFVFRAPDGQVELRRPAVGLDADHILNARASHQRRVRLTEKGSPL